jgi:UDP-N-acetylmuramoylalanine--D-glutamate ligase
MEEVGRLGKVLFVNDSKATNADSAAKALASFPRDIYWILGGKPKEGGIAALVDYFARISKAYLIGEATEGLAAGLESRLPFERCGTLAQAVAAASRDACASYDQFKNFEERGDVFRRLVSELPGVELKPRAAA